VRADLRVVTRDVEECRREWLTAGVQSPPEVPQIQQILLQDNVALRFFLASPLRQVIVVNGV